MDDRAFKAFLILALSVFLLGLSFVLHVAVAHGHGKHNSPIQPAYDCYHNPTGPDTRGNVEITHDLDLNVYTVWKCRCVWTEMGFLVCYWHNAGQYAKKWKAVRRAKELTRSDARYADPVIRAIRVTWSAHHQGTGCWSHFKSGVRVITWKRAG